MHVKCLQSEKAQSPRQRELLSPSENTAAALPDTPGLESSLYFRYLSESLCNRRCVNIHFYIFIMKYI